MTFTRRRVVLLLAAILAALTITSPASAASTGITWCDSGHASLDVLGDSGATGYGSTGYPANAQTWQSTTYGWVKRLSDRLGPTTTVHTYAHNGAMASDFLPGGRWPDTTSAINSVRADHPAGLILELGGNEYNIQVSPAQYQANMQTLINQIKAASPATTIFISHIWQIGVTQQPVTYPWGQYRTADITLATNNGAGFVDLEQYMPSATTNSTGPVTGLYTSDNIHPNDAGNLLEAAVYTQWLFQC